VERTTEIARRLAAANGDPDRTRATALIRKFIAEGIARPRGKAGNGGLTSSFLWDEHATEAFAIIAFLHDLGLRDCEGLSRTWEGLLDAPEGERTPIARIVAELEAHGLEGDLPAFQVSEHHAANDPNDVIVSTRIFYYGATDLSPPERDGYRVALHINLRLGVILRPFIAAAR
jgi:hypothetical protein